MKKPFATLICFFILWQSFCQPHRSVTTYLLAQYNKTLYDYTAGNNPWGMGLGVQTFINTKTKFKLTIELTGDIYLEDDKVLRLNPDGTLPVGGNDVGAMVNLFAGPSFHPQNRIYLALSAGPSFINNQILLGIKPTFGIYLSKNQRWTGKLSYINVFNRTKMVKEDFGSLSLAIGCKLF